MTDYKLVPVEPTQDMLSRAMGVVTGWSGPYGEFNDYLDEETAREVYAAFSTDVPAVKGEPVVRQSVDELRFEYRHPKTGEAYTVSLGREEVVEWMGQELFEKLTACFCECEPIGETNVVECRCDEYADEFELVAAPQPAPNALTPTFQLGDHVRKTKGSQWKGRIVGTYSTDLTPEGYAVESDTEKGIVQIYPVGALELVATHRTQEST